MIINRLLTALAFVLPLIAAVPSHAALVTYDLTNVFFEDGATASGSFTFDTTADLYTAWSITTTPTVDSSALNGYALNGASYTTNTNSGAALSSYQNVYSANFKTANNADALNAVFAGALGSTSGSIGLAYLGESANFGFESRSIVSGSISPVPLPAALPLFGAALVGIMLFHKRQIRCTQTAV